MQTQATVVDAGIVAGVAQGDGGDGGGGYLVADAATGVCEGVEESND